LYTPDDLSGTQGGANPTCIDNRASGVGNKNYPFVHPLLENCPREGLAGGWKKGWD